MLFNYLIIGLRNLRKHLSYSIINIAGLGLGLATCLLLVTWILHELSFDRFHANADRIYRASMEYSFGGHPSKSSVSPSALLPEVLKNFPEAETGVRVYNPSSYNPFIVRKEDKLFQEVKFYFADSTFFDVFSFRLVAGSAKKALTMPQSVVLTRSTAKKYFGEEDPMGKTIQVNARKDYTITGIMEDVPDNSLIQFDFLASFSTLDASRDQIWWSANFQTFFVLSPNTDINLFQAKVNNLVKKALASELTNPNDFVRYPLIRLTDIYLRSAMKESEVTSNINYIYGFGGISLIILLIACINYINLATAKATDRAKEVSIRKVIGAQKKQLFFQFIGESVIITTLAFLLAFIIAEACLPVFNFLTGKHFTPQVLLSPSFLLYCVGALLLIAIVAGSYPAFAITSFMPATVLKGNFKNSGRGIWLRQALVIFQFSISMVLIVSTVVILKQLNFIRNVRLGYDKENVIILPQDKKTAQLYGPLREQLMNSGYVAQVGRATESPTRIGGGYSIKKDDGGEDGMIVTAMNADTTFIPALGMELAAGRNFNASDYLKYHADTTVAFILNETAIKELGLNNETGLGTRINLNNRKGEIVGIVKDFYFSSLHTQISPLVLFNEEYQLSYIFIKLKAGNVANALEAIKKISLSTLPHRSFDYEFLDQKYAGLYANEQRIGNILTVFSSLAIIIACLGLLGLVAFSASQRTKEIGIRKVMGATAGGIVVLITQNYIRLVIISIIIGLPVAYWVTEKWFLGSFVYRTYVGVWPYAGAAFAGLFVAFATASFQAVKAAFINPSQTLRSE